MTKEELTKLLKEYRENTAKLKLRRKDKRKYEKELEELIKQEAETNMCTSFEINNDIHSKNQISDKVSKTIIRKEDKIEELEEKIKEIEIQINELEEKTEEAEIRLGSLYYKEREILTAYYVDNRTAEEIRKESSL